MENRLFIIIVILFFHKHDIYFAPFKHLTHSLPSHRVPCVFFSVCPSGDESQGKKSGRANYLKYRLNKLVLPSCSHDIAE